MNESVNLTNDKSSRIISEEGDVLIQAHRKHLDFMVDTMKEEMRILNEVDKPGSSIDAYIKSLNDLLVKDLQSIYQLQEQMAESSNKIKESQTNTFNEPHEVFDVFELENENINNSLKNEILINF